MSPRTWLSAVGLCGFLLALASLAGFGQDAGKGRKYALLVGVTDYDSKNFSTLNYTGNDADQMAKALRESGFASVRVLTSERGAKDGKDMPTAANVRAALKELLAKKTRHDTVLVGLAGHGIQLEVTDPEEKGEAREYSYFCPSDASLQGISYRTGRSDKLLLLDDLFADLGKSDAGHRLALIDACRNNSKVKAARRRIDVSRATIPDGVGVLFSCSRGQFAFETPTLGRGHGVFFYHVIQGLRGEAKNRRGVVTWDGLAGYVKAEVPEFVKAKIGDGARQVPASMGNLEGESVLARIVEEPKGKDGGTKAVDKDKDKAGKEAVVKGPPDKDGKNSIGMQFVLVKKGKFTMGSPNDEKVRTNDEPAHEVEITKDFYLGVHEVTQGQFREVMGFNPSHFSLDGKGDGRKYTYTQPGGGKDKVKGFTRKELDNFPVENVSWDDVQEFINKLDARAAEKEKGREYRLPTEAEWEYACRGGPSSSTKPFHFKQSTDSLSSTQANFNGDYPYGGAARGKNLKRTEKVGAYEANRLGIHDMHGNVWEWCQDFYDKDYYASSPARDPLCLKGRDRVVRGGSWYDSGPLCRSAYRHRGTPGYRSEYLGFRLAH